MNGFLSLFRRAQHVMEETRRPWILFFEDYEGEDACVMEFVRELAVRLRENRYPKGELAWQEVLKEQREKWDFSKETFDILLKSGSAFFGQSQQENLELFRLYTTLLMECKEKEKCEFAEKRKIWIPVGALGGIMVVIILI